ncbi:MAG: AlwI family type II restriction endonuclease [Longicatena sp.]|uniref:AlwI family type II restriction endonuclease n=1 Tax=Anaerorhabdus sp. TaxID=1872524 RepID=UPI002FC9848F
MCKVELEKIKFKSYCWSIGTTSFRMKYFNLMIEEQLRLLKIFFEKKENKNKQWSDVELQSEYYDFLKCNNFIKGEANNKAKDARQKTSGLVDIGLIDDNRRLTEVGEELLKISLASDFKDNNFFGIDKDSYIYMLQLLKYTTDNNIRPFIVLLKVLIELGSISYEEFTYVIPLVVDAESARVVVENIKNMRNGALNVEEIMLKIMWDMENYKAAYSYFLSHDSSEATFRLINMNRKSTIYDKPYSKLYELLVQVYVNKDNSKIYDLYEAINKLSGKAKGYWKKLIFSPTTRSKVKKNGVEYLKDIPLSKFTEEFEIKKYIFETIHLFKWKSTLDDYSDLNKRYFNLSDLIIFEDEKVTCSFLANQYFKSSIEDIFNTSFSEPEGFDELITIEEILGDNVPQMEDVQTEIAAYFDEEYLEVDEIQEYVNNERLKRFEDLIDRKFPKEILLYLVDCFEKRNDDELNAHICDNANPPTMFEYILGIIWYNLSGRKGNILDFMNLSLDANLLPKSHAGGGEADIIYKYDSCDHYPMHELLLEATLADDSTQRRMEMEPVSRHLLKNLSDTKNTSNYAVLVSTSIHPSVISDFRGRAKTEQTLDNVNYYDGIKLIPLDTNVIKNYINSEKTYEDIYEILEDAYHSEISMRDGWYELEILNKS